MARYNNPKTGKTVEARNSAEAMKKFGEPEKIMPANKTGSESKQIAKKEK